MIFVTAETSVFVTQTLSGRTLSGDDDVSTVWEKLCGHCSDEYREWKSSARSFNEKIQLKYFEALQVCV